MIKDFKELASDIEKSDKKSRIFFDFFNILEYNWCILFK